MKIIISAEPLRGSAVALGNFDGIHVGHRAIIRDCVELARREGLSGVVWTFSTHPQLELSDDFSGNILSLEDKIRLLEGLGVSCLCLEEFSRVRSLSCEQFCREILIDRLDAKAVFCGFNFRFGRGGEGDADFLKRYLEPRGVRVVVSDPICLDGDVVSSTRIRRLLSEGDVASVSRLLARPYSIRFPVEHGQRLGTAIGFPTINQSFPSEYVIPRKGVYAVRVRFDGVSYGGVCNVGCRPTVSQTGEITAETHLFDFEGDLYGKSVAVEFLRFLRPEEKFASVEELRDQIRRDQALARSFQKEKK